MTRSKRPRGDKNSGGVNPNLPVGPGNPPLKYKFAKGQPSANPRGRPLKSRNLKTVWREQLAKKVAGREGQKKRRVPMVDALVLKTIARALEGSERANDKALDAAERFIDGGLNAATEETTSEDREIMRVLEERMRAKIKSEENKR